MQRMKCKYCKNITNIENIQFYPNECFFNVCKKCLWHAVKEQSHLKGKLASKKYPENYFIHKNVPIDFLNANIWTITENQKFMLNHWNMIKKRDFGKGIIFYGDVGVGKTYMLYAFMKDVCMYASNYETLFITEKLFFDDFKNKMKDELDLKRDYIEKCEDANLVFYDDLGSQIKTINGDWGKEKLFSLINYCSDSNKPLILTTNIKKEFFIDCFGARTADRLNALEYIALFDDQSLRKPKSQNIQRKR